MTGGGDSGGGSGDDSGFMWTGGGGDSGRRHKWGEAAAFGFVLPCGSRWRRRWMWGTVGISGGDNGETQEGKTVEKREKKINHR